MTTDIKELVKRLGYYSENPATGKLQLTNPDGPAATDALEALAGEVERLKMEAKTATTLLEAEKWARAHVKSIIVSDLEAERDRLKAAVTEALNNAQDRLDYNCKCKDCTNTLPPVEDVLRKALGGDAS